MNPKYFGTTHINCCHDMHQGQRGKNNDHGSVAQVRFDGVEVMMLELTVNYQGRQLHYFEFRRFVFEWPSPVPLL